MDQMERVFEKNIPDNRLHLVSLILYSYSECIATVNTCMLFSAIVYIIYIVYKCKQTKFIIMHQSHYACMVKYEV